MRINELLVESQQLDEGPFTQAIGKVGGKIAKGVANVGKDLKTGFKAGYSGEQPAPRDPDVPMNPKTGKPLTEPERQAHQDAGGKFDGVTGDPLPLDTKAGNSPAAKKPGLLQKIGQAASDFTQGFQQGSGQAASANTGTTAAPAATAAAPASNPAAEKQSKVGVGQINKIIPTLRTRDLMSLQANLEKAIASKKKAPPADATSAPAADAVTTTPPAAPGSDAAKDDLYGAGNRPKGAKDKVAALKAQNKKQAAPSQAEIDADRARLMGANSESTVKKGRVVAESFSLYRRY
jgi:hypothetical protein